MANHDHSSPMSRFRITPMVGVGKDGNAVGLIRPPSSIECSFSIAVSTSRPRASHSALHPAEVHCLMLSAGAGASYPSGKYLSSTVISVAERDKARHVIHD